MSYRIMKVSEYDNNIFYRASCMCGSENCDLTLEIEYDDELGEIILSLYKKLYWNDENFYDNFLKRYWKRLKASFKLLFTGNININSNFIFENKRQIKEFTSSLEDGIIKIDKMKRLDTAKIKHEIKLDILI